jgi:hypothetical protein
MKGIDRAGKRKAIENSPTSEDSTTSPRTHSAPAWVTPDALRRRTAEGHVAGQGRAEIGPRQSTVPPRGASDPSADPDGQLPVGQLPLLSEAALYLADEDFGTESDAGVALHREQAVSMEQRPCLPTEVLNLYALELSKLTPLIQEVKEGVATPNAISLRPGVTSSFRNTFNSDGTLRPASANASAKSMHHKLQLIEQSHPQVAEAFKEAISRPVEQPRHLSTEVLNRYARDLEKLTPLINEVKDGLATLRSISRRPGVLGVSHFLNPDGTLKPASSSKMAKSVYKKLQAIRESHPEVAEEFQAAIARPSQYSRRRLVSRSAEQLDQFADELKNLIPFILELKEGVATSRAISRRAGMSNSFRNTFNSDGTLKPASATTCAKSIHNKLQAIRKSHPEVAEAFETAIARPHRKAPSRRRVKTQDRQSAPLAINEFGARRHELARLILQIRQGAVSLQDAEIVFPGLSRLMDPSGLWRNEHELTLAFDELVAPIEQENFFRLRQEVDQLLAPGALPPGESSARPAPAQAQGADEQRPGSAAHPHLMIDLNQPWVEPGDEPPAA